MKKKKTMNETSDNKWQQQKVTSSSLRRSAEDTHSSIETSESERKNRYFQLLEISTHNSKTELRQIDGNTKNHREIDES